MGSLLDAIGAAVIGSLLLISMFNAIFNVQAIGQNIKMLVTLYDVSDKVTSVIESYLSKVGLDVDTTSAIIGAAAPDSFKFLGKMSLDTLLAVDTFLIVDGDSIPDKGYPLRLLRNDSLKLGPFYLSDTLKFTYYTGNDDSLAFPIAQVYRDSIRYVKVEMEFSFDRFSTDPEKRKIRHRITFWKYFKNLYLRDNL